MTTIQLETTLTAAEAFKVIEAAKAEKGLAAYDRAREALGKRPSNATLLHEHEDAVGCYLSSINHTRRRLRVPAAVLVDWEDDWTATSVAENEDLYRWTLRRTLTGRPLRRGARGASSRGRASTRIWFCAWLTNTAASRVSCGLRWRWAWT